MPDRVAIVGSREQDAYDRRRAVEQLVDELSRGTVLVTGDAFGVDAWAKQRALFQGIVVVQCMPPWKALGRRAGPIRNLVIVDLCDRLIAFPREALDTQGSGTWDAIRAARAAGKPVEVRHVESPVPARGSETGT